jgi:hypothetical protein
MRWGCEKFVGPMPVNEFLSEFVPEAAEKRPANEISFSDLSTSQKEEKFVSHRAPSGINANEYNRSMQWKNLVFFPNSHLKIPLLVKVVQKEAETRHLHLLEAPRQLS